MLMIEDNPADVRLAQEAFKAAGTGPTLTVAKDGAEALRYLRREPPYENAERPDIIVLDLNLPKLNGTEVLHIIKNDDDLRRIPVIVWTTSRSEKDVASVYDQRANCCLTKPVDLDSFFRMMNCAQYFWFEVATLPAS
jgi:CheY-like chemotaxis protein